MLIFHFNFKSCRGKCHYVVEFVMKTNTIVHTYINDIGKIIIIITNKYYTNTFFI